MKSLNIVHLFPDLLNLYGDYGNIVVLKKRAELRGINANIINISINDDIPFSDADIILLGGGNDNTQLIANEKLLKLKNEFHAYRDDYGTMLAVCGGFPLLGHYLYLNGTKTEGLSLCDLQTEENKKRLTGNIAIQTQNGVAVGFENHSGRTFLGENATPFGNVIRGFGNNGEDKTEGVLYKNITGTYLHGPLLPKNPEIADDILKKALERKYNENMELEPLNDIISEYAKSYILDITKGK